MDSEVEQLHSRAEPFVAKFQEKGDASNTEEAISLDRGVLQVCPPGHPMQSVSSTHLAIDPLGSYNQLGAMSDLERAIVLYREALDIRPQGHPARSRSLNSLAVGLSIRYQQLGTTEDLDEAIVLGREALALRPRGHRDRLVSLNNLAVDLSSRNKYLKTIEDLDEAIALEREILDICPHGHPDRSTSLNKLAVGLSTRYKQLGRIEDLSEAIMMLEMVGDNASNAGKQDEAVEAYSAALLLGPTAPRVVMIKWANVILKRGSALEVLSAATKFKVPRFVVYRIICDILEGDGRLTEAVECFLQMQNELPEDAGVRDGLAEWVLDFRGRCVKKLEKLGDAARDLKEHEKAIGYYSNALSLDLTNNDILLKRSREDIELDPSSHRAYERKHAALHAMGRHSEAFKAFREMLSRLEQSPHLHIRELRNHYVDATATIQEVVEETTRNMPRVLIDTTTGRLYDKAQQAAAFEELPIYDKLRSSMTTRLDYARIQEDVKEFYRYVMLSHRWQLHEPTFQMVENISIYGLPESPGNSKVQRFCELVRSLHFQWAWSDSCCINQQDKGVLQESVVAMFRWYRGASLTIVHLLGVLSKSQVIGCLRRSIWNTRAWTYQEYIASKVVQFYTEDWKPYLGLDIFNHKESPIILSEMEQAMNFSSLELATLEPGLERAREKLYLASRRQTTREEDVAYSLFGIFGVPIPVMYGEGNQAVGRLLEYILTRSNDATLLAWTGRADSHHSYFPVDLTVYSEIVPPHLPRPIETAEMDSMVMALRSSLPDLSLAVFLYEQLDSLPPASLLAGRLSLPGIVFPLASVVCLSESDPDSDLATYRATSPMLGDVEFQTTDRLSGMERLCFIYPWISSLLDQDFLHGIVQFDLPTCALRLVVRLRQSFGVLLLAPQWRAQYRRVATDSLIMVRVREETLLTELMGGISTLHIR